MNEAWHFVCTHNVMSIWLFQTPIACITWVGTTLHEFQVSWCKNERNPIWKPNMLPTLLGTILTLKWSFKNETHYHFVQAPLQPIIFFKLCGSFCMLPYFNYWLNSWLLHTYMSFKSQLFRWIRHWKHKQNYMTSS